MDFTDRKFKCPLCCEKLELFGRPDHILWAYCKKCLSRPICHHATYMFFCYVIDNKPPDHEVGEMFRRQCAPPLSHSDLRKKSKNWNKVLARFSPKRGGHLPICDKHGTVCKVLIGNQALFVSEDPVAQRFFLVCDNPEQCYHIVSADAARCEAKDLEDRFLELYSTKLKRQEQAQKDTANEPKRKATLPDIDDVD